MGRGALPSYQRLSHVPNILEAYRYLTRRNLTVISAELKMSYHTVRRLCTEYSSPRDVTLAKITEQLSFIDATSWDQWKLLTESALSAERVGDILLLTQIEDKLKELIPVDGLVDPLHIMYPCSLANAAKMHSASLTNKTYSFYLSDLHSESMDLLAIKAGVTKSELLRQLIDEAISKDPEVLEALVRSITGQPVQVVEEEPSVQVEEDIIEITSEEDLAKLAPGVPVEEVVHQLITELPSDLDPEMPDLDEPETVDLVGEPVDYTQEDQRMDIEEWRPSATMTSDSNLSEDEIARLFSGED